MSGSKEMKVTRPVKPAVKQNTRPSRDMNMKRLENQISSLKVASQNKQQLVDSMMKRQIAQIQHVESKYSHLREQSQQILKSFTEHKTFQYEQMTRMKDRMKEQTLKQQQFIENTTNQMKQLSVKHQQDLASIKKQMQTQDDKLRQEIIAQEKRIQASFATQFQDLTQKLNAFKQDTNEKIKNVRTQMIQEIIQTKVEFNQKIHDLTATIQYKENMQYEKAKDWMDMCKCLIETIKTTRHQFFEPNRLDRLIQKYNRITNHAQSYAYQAMIASGMELFDELTSLSDDIHLAEMNWHDHLFLLQDQTSDMITSFNELKQLTYDFQQPNGTKTIEANVDYWSNQKLSLIREEIYHLLDELDTKGTSITLEQIKDFHQKERIMMAKLDQIAEEAKDNLLLSQSRFETAQRIDQTMQTMGYHVVDYTYENNDSRKPLYMKLADGLGNEMVVSLSPEESLADSYLLHIDFFNKENDEQFFSQSTHCIYDQLKSDGIDIELPKTTPGYERKSSDRHELKDIEQLRRKGQSQI